MARARCDFRSCLSGPPTQHFTSCSLAMAWPYPGTASLLVGSGISTLASGPVLEARHTLCPTLVWTQGGREEASADGTRVRTHWVPGQWEGAGPGDPAACGLGPCLRPACLPCQHPCQRARATLRRMEAELYSSWLEKRTSGQLCTRPPPLTPPRSKEDRQPPSARLSPLPKWRQVSAAQGRVGCGDRVARAGQGWGGCCLGGGGRAQGHFSSWELLAGTDTELRAPGRGRGCLGCARRPI